MNEPLIIKPGSTWRYVGPGVAHGDLQGITSANDQVITTWGNGHAWLGTPLEFDNNFQPA